MATPNSRASEEEIAQALEGNWQQDQLFLLRQEQAGYEFCQKQITECDQQLARYRAQLEDRSQGATLPEETRKGRRNKRKGHPQFNLREELFRMTGTDLTQIDGIDVMAAMTVVSEVGWDMSSGKPRTILFPG
jgi:transposase